MLKNSRKRARKTKLEVREGVELDETTVFYMEAFGPKVKDEPMIDVSPTELINNDTQIEDPFNDITQPVVDHKPVMEFSVKVEVEECDETEIKEIQNSSDNQTTAAKESKLDDTSNSLNRTLECQPANSVPNNIEPTMSKIGTQIVKNGSMDTFKEYFTNRPMILKIIDRLNKSNETPDKLLSIVVKNYAGRVLDEPVKDARDLLLHCALEEWQTWYQINSDVRDSPLLYKCYICGKSWWYMYDFKEHISQHITVPLFLVSLEANNDECSLVCFQLDIVYNDIVLPETNCNKCGKSADSHAFADSDPYKCLECKTLFSTCTQLHKHEMTCSQHRKILFPEESEAQKCSICLFECKNHINLNEHMTRTHTVRSDLVTMWDVKICNICGRSYILTVLHVCIKRTNNYGCNYCGRSFQKKVYKEIHMANYSEPTECRVCNKQLISRCMEFSHMLQHTDKFALLYKCIQCIEGRYYPDEFSIMHHTKVVHDRPFEKKFKYLEMVILPKRCLEKSTKISQTGNDVMVKPTIQKVCPTITQNILTTEDTAAGSEMSKDVAKSNVFSPSTKYTTTHKKMGTISVVVKQEPMDCAMDIDTLCVTDLSTIKTEPVDETAPHINISDITSLQDLIKFKTEPLEEVMAEDLIIVEEKTETVTLNTSDDSEYDSRWISNGQKSKNLKRYACICGYVDTRRKLQSHQKHCTATLAKLASKSEANDKRIKDNILGEIGDVSQEADNDLENIGDEDVDDEQEEVEDVEVEGNSDEDWNHDLPLMRNYKTLTLSGLKYTCHCKKEFVGTLAAFKRHKAACAVVAKLRAKESSKPTSYKCTKCSNQYPSILKYAKHFHKIHQCKKLVCPHCQATCPNLVRLSNHLTSHYNRNYLKIRLINETQQGTKCNRCKVCQEPVERSDYFMHWESHLELKVETGDKAAESDSVPEEDRLAIDSSPVEIKSVYSPHLLRRALKWLQSPDGYGMTNSKTCVFCARQFTRQNDSKRHVIEHLLYDAYAQRAELKELRCPICGQGFLKEDKYKHHMREHASLPVYQCNLCGKSFSDSSNFCKHKKVHDLSLLRCGVCDKKFHNRSHLDRHMEMHEKTKPMICEYCDKISFTMSAHKKHVRYVHERYKARVLCHICRASFTRLKDKWDHLWLVHKERKFEADCPLCPESFRRFADVKTHVKDVHKRCVRLGADGQYVVYV